MADIGKCTGEGCYLRTTCYRYTAPANEHWQSYGSFSESPKPCEYYWHRCRHISREGSSCNRNNKCTYPNCTDEGPLNPIHKFNNGKGATLCHHCSVIILHCFSGELYCKECLEKRQQELDEQDKAK